MIPLRDDNPTRTFPFVTITLIAVNVLVFLYEFFLPAGEMQRFVAHYAVIPQLISQGKQLHTIFTSMFLHGGLFHIAGNMLYLWIFGDNVEHICGHFRYLIFYLVCGAIAFFSHYLTEPLSAIPMLGASGAISGILGAYVLRFPRARVHVFIWLFFIYIDIIPIPAIIVLGFWFIMQLFTGLSAPAAQGGVAVFAHIGGFIAGLILIRFFERKRYRISY